MSRFAKLVGIMVAAALLGSVLSAQAAPSLEGYTGLLLTPTADALDQGEYNVAFSTLNLEEGGNTSIWTGNYGSAAGTEIGVARIKLDHATAETVINGKYRIRGENGGAPALAVGVIDATDEIDTSVYLVMSKSLSKVIATHDKEITNPRLHVGIGGGGRLDGFFAGASVVLGDALTLMAEYDTRNVNLGARLAVGHGVRVQAGWIDGLDDFALGASFNKVF